MGYSLLTDSTVDINAVVPPLANYALAAVVGSGTLTGYYVDIYGKQVGALVTYTITTTPTTFTTLAGGTLPAGAVGFIGSLTGANLYEALSGNADGSIAQNPGAGYPQVAVQNFVKFGRAYSGN